jgi:hypothetical protein
MSVLAFRVPVDIFKIFKILNPDKFTFWTALHVAQFEISPPPPVVQYNVFAVEDIVSTCPAVPRVWG